MPDEAATGPDSQIRLRTPLIKDADTLRRVVTADRLRIYEYLVKQGPSRVSEIANGLNLAIGSVSFHLGVLNDEKFIERADELAPDRRSKYWRAVPGGIRFALTGSSGEEEYTGAVESAHALLNRRRTELTTQWLRSQASWPARWREAAADVDSMLRLSPEQTEGFVAEMMALIGKWKAAEPSQDQESVFVALTCFPVRDDAVGKS